MRCLINLQNAGAGIPDGGLFTANQFPKGAAEPLSGQLPARGALEVKPVADDVHVVAESEQVRRYLEKYRQVLVTTYREFVLVGFNAEGEAASLESFSLAAGEQELWALAAHPGSDAARQAGERLTDFLRRVLLRQAQIAAPKDLAWFLASYAREARARAEERDLPNWVSTRKALEEALGMSFSGEKGKHFFRSTLVQTLFYGLFAAWVFWAEHHPPTDAGARFRWREAAGYLHIPILQKLFYDFSNPGALGLMRIDEVLDWAAEALNRVDRASFFSSFEQSHAVQYFYEPFLEAFDPELRKELGVWYTPPEIVQYMVARVDVVLREELGIPDGLADPRVVVLDPCCGTGAYLVEVLNKIAATLAEKSGGVDALAAHEIKQAAMSRIYGFEILPAPFVIGHLQIGMLLHRLGASFADESDERAGVYLTNALTGWEPPTEPKQHLLFPEMEEERDKAQAVKQHAPILVILGNPPYNGFASLAMEEERDLVDSYRDSEAVPQPEGKGLNDLYVRFFRMAERRIVEGPEGRGIVCLVPKLGLPFKPRQVTEGYLEWPVLQDLFPVFFPGVLSKRSDLVVDIDRERLDDRMRSYFDPLVTDEAMARLCPMALQDMDHFDAQATRRRLEKRGYLPDHIVPHTYRPFDRRWLYWEPETNWGPRALKDDLISRQLVHEEPIGFEVACPPVLEASRQWVIAEGLREWLLLNKGGHRSLDLDRVLALLEHAPHVLPELVRVARRPHQIPRRRNMSLTSLQRSRSSPASVCAKTCRVASFGRRSSKGSPRYHLT